MTDFERELKDLINKHSIENKSDTPDFILARFLMECLLAYSDTVNRRDGWYGDKHWDEKPAAEPPGQPGGVER